jgi:predicted ester cyclase
MAQPDRQALADGLVRIGEDAVARNNDRLLDEYFTDDYVLHSPAGEFNRDQIKAYFAALRASFSEFTISRAQILVDGNYVGAPTVMAGRFDNDFAYTPVGNVTATGKRVRWELHNIFRYTDDGQLAEEWVQTDTVEFLRQLGAAPGF